MGIDPQKNEVKRGPQNPENTYTDLSVSSPV